ncbi:GPW/gp25 family protein [Parerythrobacter jejuensis]|uniref:Baseplate assembly protein n=1 Tax=Parerythrobacter jejuensis TaxID=795812 RepID=A0A845ANS6_9SPHN|nr:GPW/gp25 family protein [Parerythrobacter jejuensis]MXP31264.1 baseplate assembly protein [Parerythrobacter jejuensis]MXP34024.1 baseplate assembly protein [Parerythrobacter jejuensis]
MTGPIFTSSKLAGTPVAVGWPLLPVPDENGRMQWPDGPASIRQSIEVILRTAPGELLMREQFGAGLEQMLDRPNDVATRNAIRQAVSTAITRYESRVQLERVAVAETDDPRRVDVTISYRIRPSGTVDTLRAAVDVGGA